MILRKHSVANLLGSCFRSTIIKYQYHTLHMLFNIFAGVKHIHTVGNLGESSLEFTFKEKGRSFTIIILVEVEIIPNEFFLRTSKSPRNQRVTCFHSIICVVNHDTFCQYRFKYLRWVQRRASDAQILVASWPFWLMVLLSESARTTFEWYDDGDSVDPKSWNLAVGSANPSWKVTPLMDNEGWSAWVP